MKEDGGLSRSQWALLAAAETFLTGLELGGRLRRRRGFMPTRAIFKLGVEFLLQSRFPRVGGALIWTRTGSRWIVGEILPSRPVARALQRDLTTDPGRALRRIERLSALVRATRWLHFARWGPDFTAMDLRSTTFDGTLSSFLEKADFSDSSLEEVRFFGMLDLACFDRAALREVTFIGCALRRVGFREAKLEDVVVASGPASQCSFAGARISHCTISDVELQWSSFTGAEVRDVVFERCDFEGVEFADATWENVDFVECRNADDAPARADARKTLGATPRSLARSSISLAGPAEVTVRYAQALSLGRAPFGYRLQTLTRDVYLWIALGSSYRRVREEQAADPAFPVPNLPRSRLLHAAKTLVGVSPLRGETPSLSGVVYRLLMPGFEERYPDIDRELPELVLVDGERAIAKYVEVGGRSYIVISFGMEVMAIRLARYCIAWLHPESVRYMDSWPERRDPAAMRMGLIESLWEFARSGGDVGGMGRIQVGGLPDRQATSLAMTFLAFVVGHELGHFLQADTRVPTAPSAEEIEMRADVTAAEFLQEEHELEAVLLEGIGRAGLGGFSTCDWHAGAVAAIILITRGPAGSLSGGDLEEWIAAVIRSAFGEQVATALENEMAEEGSVLNLLREVLLRGSARAS